MAAARLCDRLGHDVEEIACPFDASVTDDFLRYWGFVSWLQARTARVMMCWRFDTSRMEPWTRGLVEYYTRDMRTTWEAIARLRRFGAAFAAATRKVDVLVSPVVAEPAPSLGWLATDLPFETVFERLRAFAGFTCLYNTAGAPAISLPLGRSASGLPIGVQFGAAPGNDRTLLELARSLEVAQPWPKAAP
jgi:amidase